MELNELKDLTTGHLLKIFDFMSSKFNYHQAIKEYDIAQQCRKTLKAICHVLADKDKAGLATLEESNAISERIYLF